MQFRFTLLIVLFLSIAIYSQQNKYFDAPFGGGLGYVVILTIDMISNYSSGRRLTAGKSLTY